LSIPRLPTFRLGGISWTWRGMAQRTVAPARAGMGARDRRRWRANCRSSTRGCYDKHSASGWELHWNQENGNPDRHQGRRKGV